MPAYARFAAAIALAVSTAAFAAPVTAADLYEPPYDEYGEGPPPPDRYADVPDDFEPPYPPTLLSALNDSTSPFSNTCSRSRSTFWKTLTPPCKAAYHPAP